MTLKKLAALALALVLVLSVSVTALAAIGNGGLDTTGGNTLTFTKSILMKNKNASSVRQPNIIYTYTIADAGISTDSSDGDPAYKVTDSAGNTGYVYSVATEGVALTTVLPTATATVTFSDGEAKKVTTSEAGVQAYGDGMAANNVSFTFVGSAFPHPGIYRFTVTESTNVTKASVGIIESANYVNTMYLDVYVKGASGGNEIYGYVLFEKEQNADIKASEEPAKHEKSEGWSSGDAAGTEYQNQDIYETYDVEVSKTVDSDATGKANEFPFVVTLSQNGTANKIDYTIANGTITGTAPTSVSTSTSTVFNAGLKDQGKLTITGIPAIAATTVDAVETNNTYDVYTATPTVNGTAESDAVLQKGETKAITQLAVAAKTLEKQTVAYANVMTTISPTGYVVRIAPYAMMLIGGATLFIILAVKRRKNEEEEA